jgi:diguanylate cyclase (GGDEF)-like protein/PAS domain S-box-containing protein
MTEKPTYEELEKRVKELEKAEEKSKHTERALRESEERFRKIAENSLVGVNIIQDDIFVYVNPKFAEIFGYSVEECLDNMHFQQLVYNEDIGIVEKEIRRRESGKVRFVHYGFRGIKKSGKIIHIEIYGSLIQMNGRPAVVGTILDITTRKTMEKELRRLATMDSLTGVNNRRNFLDLAQKEINRSTRYNHHFSLMMLDIDYFKRINDTYGHSVGDQMLRAFCDVCKKELREEDIMGRLGGEEFSIALIGCDMEKAMIFAERIRRAVNSHTLTTGDEEIRITVSLGITSMLKDDDLNSMLERADSALYKAKVSGRNQVQTVV